MLDDSFAIVSNLSAGFLYLSNFMPYLRKYDGIS
jgi:hypothetical protein